MTEQELEKALATACGMTLERQRIAFALRVAKFYAAAQEEKAVSLAVHCERENLNRVVAEKDAEITQWREQTLMASYEIDRLRVESKARDAEIERLKAENERLREGITVVLRDSVNDTVWDDLGALISPNYAPDAPSPVLCPKCLYQSRNPIIGLGLDGRNLYGCIRCKHEFTVK